jgi:hypothetical protein
VVLHRVPRAFSMESRLGLTSAMDRGLVYRVIVVTFVQCSACSLVRWWKVGAGSTDQSGSYQPAGISLSGLALWLLPTFQLPPCHPKCPHQTRSRSCRAETSTTLPVLVCLSWCPWGVYQFLFFFFSGGGERLVFVSFPCTANPDNQRF